LAVPSLLMLKLLKPKLKKPCSYSCSTQGPHLSTTRPLARQVTRSSSDSLAR
jgi:hypothetical protein